MRTITRTTLKQYGRKTYKYEGHRETKKEIESYCYNAIARVKNFMEKKIQTFHICVETEKTQRNGSPNKAIFHRF